MARKKTRKQKEAVDYSSLKFVYEPGGSVRTVKREFGSIQYKKEAEPKRNDNAEVVAQTVVSVYNKRDIVKSLLIASLILSLELMLYFVWK